jgi:type II secretory pathway pseudopilin PulG
MRPPQTIAAFTLIELVLVMGLLGTLMALSAPSLSRSFHGRNLTQQAAQLLAATEYARSEAVSQGIPMNVWIAPDAAMFGVEAKSGYEGTVSREKTWTLPPDIHFGSAPTASDGDGHTLMATYLPEGTLDDASVDNIALADRTGETVTLRQNEDGYEIAK